MKAFELAWTVLKDASMHGESPFKDAREQALLEAKPFTPPPEKTPQERAMEELGLHPSELGASKKERRFMNQVYPEEHKGKNRAGLDFPVVSEGYEGVYPV